MLDRLDSYPNQQLRHALVDFTRTNAHRLVILVLFTVSGGALLAWLLDGFLAGFLVGVMSTAMLAMAGLFFLLISGTTGSLAGSIAETNTADDLKWAARRGHVFGWADNLRVEGADVDHLVVAPAGLLMIDTKWHSSPVTPRTLQRDAATALAAAGRARNILRAVHVRRPQVRTIVVVWGGEQMTAAGHRVGDVEFVAGRDLRDWLEDHMSSGNAYNASQAEGLLVDLKAFKRRVNPTTHWPAKTSTLSPNHT